MIKYLKLQRELFSLKRLFFGGKRCSPYYGLIYTSKYRLFVDISRQTHRVLYYEPTANYEYNLQT